MIEELEIFERFLEDVKDNPEYTTKWQKIYKIDEKIKWDTGMIISEKQQKKRIDNKSHDFSNGW